MIEEVNEKRFEELESQAGGELYACKTGQGDFLFRCPNDTEWVMFERGVTSEHDIEVRKAAHKLVSRVILYPEADELQSVLKKRPAIIGVLVKQIADVAKGSEEARAKKPLAP